MNTRWPARVAFAVAIVVLPLAKALQLWRWPGRDSLRQAVLVAAGAVTVACFSRRRLAAVVGSHVALPRPARPAWLGGGRLARLGLGLASVGSCAGSAAAAVRGKPGLTVGLSAAAPLPLVALAGWERVRHLRTTAAPPGSARPDRAVLWAVAPGVLVWTGLVAYGGATGSAFDGRLGQRGLLLDGALGDALFTLVTIAFAEELLYRGYLLLLAVRARLETVA